MTREELIELGRDAMGRNDGWRWWAPRHLARLLDVWEPLIRADEAQRLAGQAASAELTRFEDGSLTISEIGPATEPGWVPVTPLLINALIDHAASARRAVAEEIAQAIGATARDEWTLGRDWVDVAADIARRTGGVSE